MMLGRRSLAALTLVASALPIGLISSAPPAQAASSECGTNPHLIAKKPYAFQSLAYQQLWQDATGKGVKVAVVDSGVSSQSPHMKTALAGGASVVPNASDPEEDLYGHGTAVASIIGARQVKGSGMVGMAPGSSIMPVRVYDGENTDAANFSYPPNTGRMAEGIEWAVHHGADVINVSMDSETDDPHLKAAVKDAVKHGAVVVAASGDRTSPKVKDGDRYPASYPGVIGVAATNLAGQMTNYSIHGPQVDVTAPGENAMIALGSGDCYVGNSEQVATSWAAGYVSALAALLKQKYAHDTAEEIACRITSTATSASRTDATGWGEIQPEQAMTATLDKNAPSCQTSSESKNSNTNENAVVINPMASDPLAPARDHLAWWAIGLGGLGAVALVVGPLVSRRRNGA